MAHSSYVLWISIVFLKKKKWKVNAFAESTEEILLRKETHFQQIRVENKTLSSEVARLLQVKLKLSSNRGKSIDCFRLPNNLHALHIGQDKQSFSIFNLNNSIFILKLEIQGTCSQLKMILCNVNCNYILQTLK